jgi:hypothetical protein
MRRWSPGLHDTDSSSRLCSRSLPRHCQVNVDRGPVGRYREPHASGRCRGVPRNERARAQKSLMAGTELMSSNGEQVANGVVDREEPLGLCHRF